MAQRRHQYEQAFEYFLRQRRIPYVAVDEARRALLPPGRLELAGGTTLKSFDFVIYGQNGNALVEIKGRRVRASKAGGKGRLESWATEEDVRALLTWGELFGAGFEPALVFVYWCDELPSSALFDEIFEHRGRWYAVRAVRAKDYIRAMRPRSRRWGTVHLSTEDFERLNCPLAPSPSETGEHEGRDRLIEVRSGVALGA